MKIRLEKGDITQMSTNAIVNAANTTLLGGGGVDGAIHRAAGPELLTECKTLNGCKTGSSKITGGYELSAKYVVHTVGPVWNGGAHNEPALLASCYSSCLDIANHHGLKSIAFPAISTGAYQFPMKKAAQIALHVVLEFAMANNTLETVVFVCFGEDSLSTYRYILESYNENT